MANKRSLKKAIRLACGDMAGECMISKDFIPGIDGSKMDSIVFKIADLQVDSINKVTFSFDKNASAFDNRHDYNEARAKYFRQAYNKLKTDFSKSVEAIVADMNAALPKNSK